MVKRVVIQIQGTVQGVGFRPFVYNLAHKLALTGWVNNSAQGVHIEAEGDPTTLDEFILRLQSDKPHHAHIQRLDWTFAQQAGEADFRIHESDANGEKSAFILPDLAICPDCLHDIRDPHNRRYRYPFTNCTYCGPRYSIIQSIPYDRSHTTMHSFEMCPDCLAEYENPEDRRFHAQPNACPKCGPQLAFWALDGSVLAQQDDALVEAVAAIRAGKIVACKGLGGFQLLVDARNADAINRLRQRKHRPHKPFATLFPSLAAVCACCEVNQAEADLLQSAAMPIVLLRVHDRSVIAEAVAPNNPYLGVMLPYTPLHVLLMDALGFPIVATSGNLSDEALCIDEHEALHRLGKIADVFLIHDRPIQRPVDDSVVQVIQGAPQVLRLARGFAPYSIELSQDVPSMLAVGAHLKNTIALIKGHRLTLSQHIGNLETVQTVDSFRRTVNDLQVLLEVQPQTIIHDLHPDYASTHFAIDSGMQTRSVQHHLAHVLAGMVDNQLESPVLGVVWDGTGLGDDGTIWGGEWLRVDEPIYERVAHLHPFYLAGGEAAIREPRRAALGMLYEVYGEALFKMIDLPSVIAFSARQRLILRTLLANKTNAVQTTSMGRLFDAVASLLDLCQVSTFEGQSAMAVEFAAIDSSTCQSYPFAVDGKEIDWRPMMRAIVEAVRDGHSRPDIAAKFHNTLVEMLIQVAPQVGETAVLLTGGCFQNRLLSERAISRLREAGFTPYWHHHIPPNDGGIAVGQLMAASKQIRMKER